MLRPQGYFHRRLDVGRARPAEEAELSWNPINLIHPAMTNQNLETLSPDTRRSRRYTENTLNPKPPKTLPKP